MHIDAGGRICFGPETGTCPDCGTGFRGKTAWIPSPGRDIAQDGRRRPMRLNDYAETWAGGIAYRRPV